MDEKKHFQLCHTFGTIEELSAYTQEYSRFIAWQERKLNKKKEGDRRGQHVAELHQKTREFIESDPMHETLSYREAFRIVSSQHKS